jgi:hypothetical protein
MCCGMFNIRATYLVGLRGLGTKDTQLQSPEPQWPVVSRDFFLYNCDQFDRTLHTTWKSTFFVVLLWTSQCNRTPRLQKLKQYLRRPSYMYECSPSVGKIWKLKKGKNYMNLIIYPSQKGVVFPLRLSAHEQCYSKIAYISCVYTVYGFMVHRCTYSVTLQHSNLSPFPHKLVTLWHVNSLLGNDREIRKNTTAVSE